MVFTNTGVAGTGFAGLTRGFMLAGAAALLTGCGGSLSELDWDLRPSDRFSTTEGARAATAARPAADSRGVISYPGYQVVVAQRGDTVEAIAARLNLNAAELARHNAVQPNTALRGGELLVLPSRIADTGISSGTITTTALTPATVAGPEPTQHTVRRGETAFTIARLYNVSPRALSEWNGLPADMSVREGQILMIPVAQAAVVGEPLNATGTATLPTTPAAPAPVTPETVSQPGTGSTTPTPPSASQPLPATPPAPTGVSATQPAAPVADMAAQRTEQPRLAMPVDGRIIRAYARGSNDGIGIGAAAGTQVRAAGAGTVAAITQDTNQVSILVIRHENNLLTVYANLSGITVARGDRVTRGQPIATVQQGDPSFLHFEVREGQESVDPMQYLR